MKRIGELRVCDAKPEFSMALASVDMDGVSIYVFVLDGDGLSIVYQITLPEYYRYGYDLEKAVAF